MGCLQARHADAPVQEYQKMTEQAVEKLRDDPELKERLPLDNLGPTGHGGTGRGSIFLEPDDKGLWSDRHTCRQSPGILRHPKDCLLGRALLVIPGKQIKWSQ